MTDHSVDARGLPCPQPLMLAKKALTELSEGEILRLLLDNKLSCDNVIRFLQDHGLTPELSTEEGSVQP